MDGRDAKCHWPRSDAWHQFQPSSSSSPSLLPAALNSERSPDDNSHEYGLKKEKKERLLPPKVDTAGGSSSDLKRKKSPSAEKAEQDYAAAIQEIRSQPGNNICADCGTPDPEWASINHGVLLCIECSGIHRSLGVHISKVRSITLDKLEPELMEAMSVLGNTITNDLLLKTLDTAGPSGLEVPTPKSDRGTREKWITAKYSERRFVEPADVSPDELYQRFYEVCGTGPLPILLKYILQGVEVNRKNSQDGDKAPLHNAAIKKNSQVTDFLLLWTSDMDIMDGQGYTPLHYAAQLDHIRVVLLLVRRAANWNLPGRDGKTPNDLAIAERNEDVVVVFRMLDANGNGRDALDKTMALLMAKNTRASLRMSQHRVRKHNDIDAMLSGQPSPDPPVSPF